MRFQLIIILRSSIVAAAIRDSFNLSLSFEIFQNVYSTVHVAKIDQ